MDPVHDPEWTQSLMDTIPHDTIPNVHHPEWAHNCYSSPAKKMRDEFFVQPIKK